MNKLYESVDMNKLYFEYVDSAKDVSFYEYVDFKEIFNGLKDTCITFNHALKNNKSYWKK